MGVGPIPGSALRAATQRLGLDEEDAEIFTRIMRSLDSVYLKEVAKDAESGGKAKPGTPSARQGSVELFDALFG